MTASVLPAITAAGTASYRRPATRDVRYTTPSGTAPTPSGVSHGFDSRSIGLGRVPGRAYGRRSRRPIDLATRSPSDATAPMIAPGRPMPSVAAVQANSPTAA